MPRWTRLRGQNYTTGPFWVWMPFPLNGIPSGTRQTTCAPCTYVGWNWIPHYKRTDCPFYGPAAAQHCTLPYLQRYLPCPRLRTYHTHACWRTSRYLPPAALLLFLQRPADPLCTPSPTCGCTLLGSPLRWSSIHSVGTTNTHTAHTTTRYRYARFHYHHCPPAYRCLPPHLYLPRGGALTIPPPAQGCSADGSFAFYTLRVARLLPPAHGARFHPTRYTTLHYTRATHTHCGGRRAPHALGILDGHTTVRCPLVALLHGTLYSTCRTRMWLRYFCCGACWRVRHYYSHTFYIAGRPATCTYLPTHLRGTRLCRHPTCYPPSHPTARRACPAPLPL